MRRISTLLTKSTKLKKLTSCTFSILLALTPATLAGYVPPENQESPSDYSKSGGIRGPEEIPLTILAPKTYIGYTTSKSPTLVWFVPDLLENNPCYNEETNQEETYPEIDFRLYEYDSNGRPKARGEAISLPAKSGVMHLPFPEEQQELVIGQTYLWQVTMLCQFGEETQAIDSEAVDLKVVEVPTPVEVNFSPSLSALEQAEIYAESGLWYDALEQALSLTNFEQLGELGASYIDDLANSEDIQESQPENSPEPYEGEKRVKDLREIARTEK
jgi:hypothetical protein